MRIVAALLTLASMAFIVAARIKNFGWFMVGGGIIVLAAILFAHFVFQFILVIRNGAAFSRAFKLSALSNLFLCLGSVIMPDYTDVGSSAVFAHYTNPPDYFMQLALLLGALGIMLSLTSVIVGWKR